MDRSGSLRAGASTSRILNADSRTVPSRRLRVAQQWSADAGLRDRFGADGPATYRAVLEVLDVATRTS
jgi:hypothetical protein